MKLTRIRPWSVLLFAAGLLLLAGSWRWLYLWLTVRFEELLVPWDMWTPPPPGTWQRSLNDFFNAHSPHLAMLCVGANVALFMLGLVRRRRRTLLPLAFAALNASFLGVDLVLMDWARRVALLWLPQPRPEVDLGYHRTWPGLVLLVVQLGLYYLAQWRGLAVWDRVRLAPGERMTA